MRETIALILLVLMLTGIAAIALHLRRNARHERLLRRGHADYSKLHRRRGLFG